MDNGGYLFAAFAIVWALVFGFVVILFGRQRKLQREIKALEEGLKQKKG
ncbi:MAG: CcmD family protein [Dehalococcoidales bacterium]|nr:CcmD family protein [Dehalococcoidales bacterium]